MRIIGLLIILCSCAEASTINYHVDGSSYAIYYAPGNSHIYHWDVAGTGTYNTDTGALEFSVDFVTAYPIQGTLDFADDSPRIDHKATLDTEIETLPNGNVRYHAAVNLNQLNGTNGLIFAGGVYTHDLSAAPDFSLINYYFAFAGNYIGLNILEVGATLGFQEVATPEPGTIFLGLLGLPLLRSRSLKRNLGL